MNGDFFISIYNIPHIFGQVNGIIVYIFLLILSKYIFIIIFVYIVVD